jgi:DMSO/TMAO reductase YedYZ molybdopterin-dependent catalytic subunit
MTTARPSTATATPGSDAIDPRLVVVTQEPFNAEAPLAEQIGLLTPTPLHYVRTNFGIPRLSAGDWRLALAGEVVRPYQLTYDELRALPSRSLLVTLECAGNGRSGLQPPASGEPWQYGAVSMAEWTGVPLATLLEAAGLTSRAREILIEGADRGTVATREGPIPFARSLLLEVALHPDTLLAYAMNGEPLTAPHGFPARLIVPGWYGMAAVKWVTRIAAIAEPFEGYYQIERYIMAHPERGEATSEPLSTMRVRSLVIAPAAGAVLPRGTHRLRGLAWSGAAPVTRVDVSVDGGDTWEPAELASGAERYAWRRWEYTWRATVPGPIMLRSRAFDEAGRTQPSEAEWNRLGYANNAIQAVPVTVA